MQIPQVSYLKKRFISFPLKLAYYISHCSLTWLDDEINVVKQSCEFDVILAEETYSISKVMTAMINALSMATDQFRVINMPHRD